MSYERFGIVVVGGGIAADHLSLELRRIGFGSSIAVVCGESMPPYDRPALSKAFLEMDVSSAELALRTAQFYQANGIDLFLGDSVSQLEPGIGEVMAKCASGRSVVAKRIVLATGSAARPLTGVPGGSNALRLQTVEDAARIRRSSSSAKSMLVIGGGFIGLELAAQSLSRGVEKVVVLEAAPRLLARSVSSATATHVAALHRADGVDVRVGTRVRSIQSADFGSGWVVALDDGSAVAADVVVAGVGSDPEVSLAESAGIRCDHGVVVDARCLTSQPEIYAIGDCAAVPVCAYTPHARDGVSLVRLESVSAAKAHAVVVAKNLVGRPEELWHLPTFWSKQGPHTLQIAGLRDGYDSVEERASSVRPGGRAYVFYVEGVPVSVEAVDAPLEYGGALREIRAARATI
ncbi:oxidoreductase [Pseudonocardia sulfidoxydans NBRC 16205]|uniref:Oxidoreductase n=1 Tax=Pseudonocardia sulfidoxydans NBRC 16205 TaxID=1223511 RepID=A0A511DSY4_9PSEU|nr:FAD-dependent oxidoreductase [Pseudonocardia sulfidoxydans]GEL26864.1 oxidoreductase [Pseudonocardia sulfidoxydans NBRC 16205]